MLNFPIWDHKPNKVCFLLAAYDKRSTLPSLFNTEYQRLIKPKYDDDSYIHVYTDGSKSNEKASYGIYSPWGTVSRRIANYSSIFTAEMEAIKYVLTQIRSSARSSKKIVIFSDSKSVLESIEIQESKNPIMIEILDLLQLMILENFKIEFCWIPSHVGIRGNERADCLAKAGLNIPVEPRRLAVPYTDLKPYITEFIKRQWQNRFDHNHYRVRPIKLHCITPIIKPFYMDVLSRRDEVIIHRLRIGHTRLTHRYLMEDPFKVQPRCEFCRRDLISVHHILIECRHFRLIRSLYYEAETLKDLFEKYSTKHILKFVREAELYDRI